MEETPGLTASATYVSSLIQQNIKSIINQMNSDLIAINLI